MINNISALNQRVSVLEKLVHVLETDKEILQGLLLEVEERVAKLENEAFDSIIDKTVDEVVDEELEDFKIGGTDVDDEQ